MVPSMACHDFVNLSLRNKRTCYSDWHFLKRIAYMCWVYITRGKKSIAKAKGKSELFFSQNNCVSERRFVVLIKSVHDTKRGIFKIHVKNGWVSCNLNWKVKKIYTHYRPLRISSLFIKTSVPRNSFPFRFEFREFSILFTAVKGMLPKQNWIARMQPSCCNRQLEKSARPWVCQSIFLGNYLL